MVHHLHRAPGAAAPESQPAAGLTLRVSKPVSSQTIGDQENKPHRVCIRAHHRLSRTLVEPASKHPLIDAHCILRAPAGIHARAVHCTRCTTIQCVPLSTGHRCLSQPCRRSLAQHVWNARTDHSDHSPLTFCADLLVSPRPLCLSRRLFPLLARHPLLLSHSRRGTLL